MPFAALIRTHHITSRKKVSALKSAASAHNCFVLLRFGGVPGMMYVEAPEKDDVAHWVDVVRGLRYKDFQLVVKPGAVDVQNSEENGQNAGTSRGTRKNEGKEVGNRKDQQDQMGVGSKQGLSEVETVKEFGSIMERKGVWEWWRKGMGYAS